MVKTMHVPQITTKDEKGAVGTFVIEPLYRGFGITLGNSLRRGLLSSLEGGAITAFGIEGVSHEFSTLEGIKEDLVQITLNLKQVRFRVFSDQPQTLQLEKKGKGILKAGDIVKTADVEIVNPEQPIATLDGIKASMSMSLKVEKGRGYVPVEERGQEPEIGMIAIDALFSPVKRVRYKVEHTRVGQVTDLDKLTLDLETDGSITPSEALTQASAILANQFATISGEQPTTGSESSDTPIESGNEPAELNFGIEDLNLSPRTTNALMNNKISTVRELLELSDTELRELKGFGAKAYHEVVDKLKELELR